MNLLVEWCPSDQDFHFFFCSGLLLMESDDVFS